VQTFNNAFCTADLNQTGHSKRVSDQILLCAAGASFNNVSITANLYSNDAGQALAGSYVSANGSQVFSLAQGTAQVVAVGGSYATPSNLLTDGKLCNSLGPSLSLSPCYVNVCFVLGFTTTHADMGARASGWLRGFPNWATATPWNLSNLSLSFLVSPL
jgi:hypothetical protein